jgi:hypothetical protein
MLRVKEIELVKDKQKRWVFTLLSTIRAHQKPLSHRLTFQLTPYASHNPYDYNFSHHKGHMNICVKSGVLAPEAELS